MLCNDRQKIQFLCRQTWQVLRYLAWDELNSFLVLQFSHLYSVV